MHENNFHTRLKELRLEKKLSQQEFGLAIGLSKQAINGIEAGRRTTTFEKLIEIAKYLNVTSDYLLGLTDSRISLEENDISTSKEEEILLKNFRSLNDISKGKLIERARILIEESEKQNKENHKMNA